METQSSRFHTHYPSIAVWGSSEVIRLLLVRLPSWLVSEKEELVIPSPSVRWPMVSRATLPLHLPETPRSTILRGLFVYRSRYQSNMKSLEINYKDSAGCHRRRAAQRPRPSHHGNTPDPGLYPLLQYLYSKLTSWLTSSCNPPSTTCAL